MDGAGLIGEQPIAEMRDIDRDSLYILPLSIVPVKTPTLKRARLTKNARLQSVTELFEGAGIGSGQMDIDDLPAEFRWPDIPIHPDLVLLRKLALLPSFDVYSLRLLLREQNIPINDHSALRLSKHKSDELAEYMTNFTRPLIKKIYGDDDVSIQSYDDIIGLFRQPDAKKAMEKLKILARRLEIRVDEVPKFLEDYGDIFLSLSYYRQCLDDIQPLLADLLEWLDDLCQNRQIQKDRNLIATCRTIQAILSGLVYSMNRRFEKFGESTAGMWDQISAARFRQVEQMIKGYHTTVGGVLCSLTIKLETWAKAFPHKKAGGPGSRAEFIMSDMRPGIGRIQEIEDSAPMMDRYASA